MSFIWTAFILNMEQYWKIESGFKTMHSNSRNIGALTSEKVLTTSRKSTHYFQKKYALLPEKVVRTTSRKSSTHNFQKK